MRREFLLEKSDSKIKMHFLKWLEIINENI